MSEFTQEEREKAIRDVVMMECGDDYDYGQADFIAWNGDPESQSAIQLACERNRLREILRRTCTVPSASPSWPCWCDPMSGRSEPHTEFCKQARAALETP